MTKIHDEAVLHSCLECLLRIPRAGQACLAAIWRLFTFIETAHRRRSMMQKKTAFSTSTKALKAFPDYLRTAAKWQ